MQLQTNTEIRPQFPPVRDRFAAASSFQATPASRLIRSAITATRKIFYRADS